MVALFKELQPIDEYTIHLSQPFSEQDRKLLLLLYQPLIEPDAVSLYLTLWADSDEHERTFNHYHLMNVLSQALQPIFQARIALEAIGLLRSYVKNEADKRSFIYELLPPLRAEHFFEDPLLSTFLYSKIGEHAYRNVRERFLPKTVQTSNYTEVSRSFLDVFQPVNSSIRLEKERVDSPLQRAGELKIPFYYEQFDFDLLYAGLSEQMVPRTALQSLSKELIAKLAFLYSFTPIDMQKVLMIALDENVQLREERVRKAAADFYKMNTSTTPPRLEKVIPQQEKEANVNADKMTREQELIQYLEQTSPKQMLRDFTGKEPLPVDIQLAERLMNIQKMPVGVVNVLLQFVLFRNDGKITNGYVERIASHWINQNVMTAEEALQFSRKEHDQYMKWKLEDKQTKTFQRQPARKEIVPEWFQPNQQEREQEKQPKKESSEQNKSADIEERRRRLREELSRPRKEVK